MPSKSPSKKLRSLKRLITYLHSKIYLLRLPPPKKSLSISPQKSLSITFKKPEPNLSIAITNNQEYSPAQLKPVLLFSTPIVIDIPPEEPKSITAPCLPISLPQPRNFSPSLAPRPPWSSSPNCLPSHLRPRPSLVSPFSSRPYQTGPQTTPQTTSKPTKNLLQSLWWSRCSYCSIFLPTWKVFYSPLCA